MKTSFTFIITLFLSLACFSQSSDSLAIDLKLKIKKATSDSVRMHYKVELIKQMHRFNPDTSKIIITDLLQQLEQIQSPGVFDQKNKAVALNYLGIIVNKQGNPEKALSHYLKALDISEAIQDSVTIGLGLHNLGMFYKRQKEYGKAKQYLKRAITIKKKITDLEGLALSHHMLSVAYYDNKQMDSARYHISIVKSMPCSGIRKAKANGTLAAVYFTEKKYDQSINIYKENIKISKDINHLSELSISYLNVAVLYNALKQYDSAVPYLDSAIVEAKKIKDKGLLRTQHYSKSNLNETRGDYKQALQDYKIYKAYNDSINDIEKVKRITALELNYKFEKEKQANELRLENETSKKQLYLLLFVIALVLGGTVFWLTRKNTKQRLELSKNKLEREQLDKVKAELSLVTKENELKKVVIENSLRREVLHKTLGEIKDIIRLRDEKERKTALQSLSASLLSEKATQNTTTDLRSYLDKVSMDFKVILDTHFPKLNEKEKELLCLMTLGLNATEISKLLNSTLSAIKSSRSRIRKKIGVDSKEDIIEFIKKTKT